MPYKQKLSIEQKVEIVQVYLKGRISMIEAARRSGVRRQSFERRYATMRLTGEMHFYHIRIEYTVRN